VLGDVLNLVARMQRALRHCLRPLGTRAHRSHQIVRRRWLVEGRALSLDKGGTQLGCHRMPFCSLPGVHSFQTAQHPMHVSDMGRAEQEPNPAVVDLRRVYGRGGGASMQQMCAKQNSSESADTRPGECHQCTRARLVPERHGNSLRLHTGGAPRVAASG
jgi:hypothetical protein